MQVKYTTNANETDLNTWITATTYMGDLQKMIDVLTNAGINYSITGNVCYDVEQNLILYEIEFDSNEDKLHFLLIWT